MILMVMCDQYHAGFDTIYERPERLTQRIRARINQHVT